MPFWFRLPLFLLAAAFALHATAAETVRVQLKNDVLVGTLLRREGTGSANERILLESGGVKLTILQSRILDLRAATPEDVLIAQGRDALKANEPEHALALFDQALGMSMHPEQLGDALANALLYSGDQLAQAMPTLDDEHTSQLLQFVRGASRARGLPPERTAELISRRLQFDVLLGQDEDTSRVLTSLGPDYFRKNEVERKRLGQWVLAALPELQNSDNNDTAQQRRSLQALALLHAIDPGLAAAQRTQLLLEWASRGRKAGHFAEALEIYAARIFPESPEIARDRMKLALDEAERWAREHDDLPSAAALYQQYGMRYLPETARERLVKIWHDQGWRNIYHHEYATARTCFETVEGLQPGASKLDFAQLEYHQRRQNVPTTDTLTRYQLGMFCLQQGLVQDAIAELKLARENPLIRENADANIGALQNKAADAELMSMMKLYNAREYGKVLGRLNGFMQQGYASGYMQQAAKLRRLTMDQLSLEMAARPQQAQVLYQNAERAYYAGRYAEANELLRTIIEHFRDASVVQAQAKNLSAAVRQKLQLARIEQGGGTDRALASTADLHTTDTATTLTRAAEEIEKLRNSLPDLDANLRKMNYQQ